MIFMLCGTSDARELALQIRSMGFNVLTSVVTESAAASLSEAGLDVRTGRMTADEMGVMIREKGMQAVVDASHPFAEEAHANAMTAARESGVPYIRYERTGLVYDNHPLLHIVPSYEEAALIAKQLKGSVMLTTGSKTLGTFTKHLLGDPEIRLVARMLPRLDNMEKCGELGMEQKNIIAMQGPFSREMNEALYKHFATTVMVTKESGRTGAVDEKVQSALDLGIHVILISRPEVEFGTVFDHFDGVINALRTATGETSI
ncbi:precorrin-6A reductase [Paenibacillus sp. CMAA1739]|uniref:precorrin-6A reductase n=1 Tax=Paenibacillus ottowii TaxID=2315729 RepID=UPI0027316EBD|nr:MULTISPECIES: precorrin-6A reductase [Paenibacillus]MDP1510370.1 precorrin-6A reductase [Paenibacillus ottowii]MEC4565787.1 precorrin-6A reductase [Paenibacillus sp. CMAA1739]